VEAGPDPGEEGRVGLDESRPPGVVGGQGRRRLVDLDDGAAGLAERDETLVESARGVQGALETARRPRPRDGDLDRQPRRERRGDVARRLPGRDELLRRRVRRVNPPVGEQPEPGVDLVSDNCRQRRVSREFRRPGVPAGERREHWMMLVDRPAASAPARGGITGPGYRWG
jgi:hypothetical protein